MEWNEDMLFNGYVVSLQTASPSQSWVNVLYMIKYPSSWGSWQILCFPCLFNQHVAIDDFSL